MNSIKEIFENAISIKADKITKIGGMTNVNYLVTCANKCYVLRLPLKSANKIVDRKRESYIENIIMNENISAKCVYFDNNSGVKITEFIKAKTLNFTNIQANFKPVANRLKKLHNSKLDFKYHFNPCDEMEKYLKIATKTSLDEFSTSLKLFYKAWEEVIKINQKYFSSELIFAPTHGDLVPQNILINGDKITLIDWEYAGLNDPCWDLASFILECNLSKELESEFLNLYGISEAQRQKLKFYKDLVDILWAIWGVAKSDENGEYLNYARDRINSSLQRNNL